jgi:hypothetical protein
MSAIQQPCEACGAWEWQEGRNFERERIYAILDSIHRNGCSVKLDEDSFCDDCECFHNRFDEGKIGFCFTCNTPYPCRTVLLIKGEN